jgi:hypothetical protein
MTETVPVSEIRIFFFNLSKAIDIVQENFVIILFYYLIKELTNLETLLLRKEGTIIGAEKSLKKVAIHQL